MRQRLLPLIAGVLAMSAFTVSPSTCGGSSVTLYTPHDETKRNCEQPAALA